MYSHEPGIEATRAGRDSILVIDTPCAANGASSLTRPPATLGADITSQVRSRLETPDSTWPTTMKRVRLVGSSSILAAKMVRPKFSAALRPAIAAVAGSRLARRAASAFDSTVTRSTPGRLRLSQFWVCASDCPCEYTLVMPSRPSRARIRFCCTRTTTSAHTLSGLLSSKSSTREIVPSVEFSTGTTEKSVSPVSVRRNASSKLAHGTASAERPNWRTTAASEKVPAGPR